jgi:hypothetical protein
MGALGDIRSNASIEALFTMTREEDEFIAMHAAQVLMADKIPGAEQAAKALKARSHDSFVVSTLDKLLQSGAGH